MVVGIGRPCRLSRGMSRQFTHRDGNGGFALDTSSPVTACSSPNAIYAQDLTNDGLPDVMPGWAAPEYQ